ncbi:MAG: 3-methyl-2-oxobutanoate hydroxymethyltransferase [Gammaproteobacteria bacterium RIFCSPHIGHO2_12_FULL_43_28]|nr:MAG: 3-methyl-2-oxobutanoate hydroxymethyltransferase [Gammaproteobacteria bacterium RIFCSPHIGHO2_12_FULL_43_28]
MNIFSFQQKKEQQEKITMITCYDYTSAKLLSTTTTDCLLVGDSVAMTMHGFKDTIAATMVMMQMHTAAVARGATNKFIVTDLPFLSYRKSLSKSVTAAQQLMQAGANALKLEGVMGNEVLIKHLSSSGIPIMGHLGLTPQFIHHLGGFKVQGKTEESVKRLKEEALALQAAGCFAIVLECVPAQVAKAITQLLAIPTIGIGAGPETDGQVLVIQDLLGLNPDFKPRFVKAFTNGHEQLKAGIDAYLQSVKSGEFPQHEHSF